MVIKLYALSTCPHCKAVKKLLTALDVKYDCLDVDLLKGADQDKALEEVRKVNPECTFPTLLVGEYVIVGNREDEIKEALSK